MLHRRFAHAYAGALAFALAFGASGLPSTSTALAKEGASKAAQAKATGADTHSAAIRAQSELPATFDLRDRGVVTPVKDQGGWGTCWTFGVSAAAETSVLSSMGTTYEGYKSATGLDLDFSERHLAYFALSPITSAQDPEQGGEGMAVLGHEYYPNAPFEGGHFCYATSLFASGAGPTLEKEYPYRGRRALTMAKTYEYLTANEREAKGTFGLVDMNLRYEAADSLATSFEGFIEGVAKRMGRSVDGFYDYVYDRMSEDAETQVGKTPTLYNTADDWSIPERDAAGLFNRNHTAGWVLKNGNILTEPSFREKDGATGAMRWKGVNWAGVNEIKSELYAGRGVAVCIRADQSLQNGENEERYINSSTWSHYAFEDKTSNHAVCIVGWDDTYSRDNFTHKVYVTDGETGVRVEDPALSELTTPGGDGAWIVKNSWGSETDCGPDDLGNEVDSRDWGVRDEQGRHTGYFYVSYYDKTLGDPESFEFTTDLSGQGRFYTAQHDYLPARYLYKETSDKVMSSANVFETGDELVSLKSVSTNTWAPEQHVDFAVYLIGDDALDPTDGTLAWRGSAQYAHAGYHRFDLEAPVDLAKGQRFSIVSTVYTTGSGGGRTYGIAANATYNRYMVDKSNEYAEAAGSAERMNTYGTAVVGKGQSYRYADGVWQDWSGYFDGDDWFEKLKAGGLVRPEETAEDYDNGLAYAVDNFSIKAYLVPTEDVVPTPAPQPTPSTRPSTTPRPSYAYTYTRPSRAATYGYGYGSSSSSDARSTTSGTTGSAASASGSSRVSRLGGAGRYDTMAGLVREGFSSSEHAVVASGASFADALAASALAGTQGCPVVLTEPGTLSTQASSVLSALGVTDTTVVGGPAAVSDAVLAALGGDVRRMGGADRYATAIEAMRAVRGMDRSSDTVVVVTGTGFADALSIGPWAWRTKSPILLAMADGTLRGDVVDAIKADGGIRRVVLVGGASAVSDTVRDQLGDGYTFERLGGVDRYETSAKVAAWSDTHGLGWSRPVVATGKGFADALSAAAVCGKTASVLLLADAASDPALGLLRQMRASVDRVWVAGGEAAVSASLMGAIDSALR